MAITLKTLLNYKATQEKFSVLTAYDAAFTTIMNHVGIDAIMIGDSLGMVIQGHNTTVPVTISQMTYHVECVSRANEHALLIADLPFMSYATPKQALRNAAKLMQSGAHIIKVEGGEWLTSTIKKLSKCGIPVCAHIGLTPQSVNKLGGYFVQGKTPQDFDRLLNDAKLLEKAGANLLVVECVPSALGKVISDTLSIPTIGIGAGPDTDGQVLVSYDILGLSPGKPAKFVKNFMDNTSSIKNAIKAYHQAVKSKQFPGSEHGYHS